MARKTAEITIDADGRDHGKRFRITEMPAAQAEEWACRAFLAMARAGAEVPEDVSNAGLAGLASIGFDSLRNVDWRDAKPLMDELMACVAIVPDANRPQVVRSLVESDIEDVATRFFLKKEVAKLHLDFSQAAARSTSAAAAS